MKSPFLTAIGFLTLASPALAQGHMPGMPGTMPGGQGQGMPGMTQPPTGSPSSQAAQQEPMAGQMNRTGMMMCPMMQGGMGGMAGRGMGSGTMDQGMMAMMGGSGHMRKVMFAIADANGDGGLSFEEVTTIHRRVFDRVDANKDGKVTPEEFQAFMRE
jgi:hypothetical protein